MQFPRSSDRRVAPWILAAIAHSALMAGFVFLISLSAGRAPRVWALALVWGEFSVGNIFLYVLMARSHRAWKAKQATSRGVWVVGSLIGGGNLALAFHLLASGGILPVQIEVLLLVSTIIVTITACLAGIFLFPKIVNDLR